jgi:hypothetical protein
MDGITHDMSSLPPEVAAYLSEILSKHHPLESTFPIGQKVLVTAKSEELLFYLMNTMDLKYREALGTTVDLITNPPTVIHIEDLEEDGKVVPFVSVMTDDGLLFLLKPEQIKPL